MASFHMIISKKYITCLLCLFPIVLFSQNAGNKDSLLLLLQKEQADTVRIFTYTKLAKEYEAYNLDSAYYFANEGLLLAKEINYYHGLAESYACLGDIEVVKDNLDLARELYIKSINFFRIVDRKEDLTLVYIVLGNIYLTQDNYFNALLNYHEGLKLAEEFGFKEPQVYLYSNLGLAYTKIESLDKALEFLQKALEASQEINHQKNIASIYINMGSIYYDEKDLQLAKSYFEKALALAIEIKSKSIESNALIAIGEIYEKEKQNTSAMEYFEKALEIAEEISDEYRGPKSILFARIYSNIGYIYFNEGNYPNSIEFLLKGYDLAQETGQLKIVSRNAEKLSVAYQKLYQINKALSYSRIFKTISDSIINEDVIKKIAKVELQNEFDQQIKEKELDQTRKDAIQKRKELVYMMTTGGSVLAVVIFILLYILLKNKVKRVQLSKKNLELEKKNLTKELDYKNKELTTNVMYLLKKNELIVNITEKLRIAKLGFKVENAKIADDIIRELEASASTNTWKEFELRFQDVHTDFYNKLNKLFPDLSPNDLKLCAFLRLNMSTKDIAAITYLSVNSINIARHRLRKKINIDKDENLITFLSQL